MVTLKFSKFMEGGGGGSRSKEHPDVVKTRWDMITWKQLKKTCDIPKCQLSICHHIQKRFCDITVVLVVV